MCKNCKEKKPFYLTTAIAYTSGKPHIGNTYEVVLADAIVRYKRMQGYDVRFQTGTDEHGQKIELKAAEAGITPKQFVDNVAGEIKSIWDLMNTSYDRFVGAIVNSKSNCGHRHHLCFLCDAHSRVHDYSGQWHQAYSSGQYNGYSHHLLLSSYEKR